MYISPSLKSKASSLVERIKSSVDKPFMTDDLVYVIMDLMDVAFKGNEKEVEKYNILSTGFTSTDRIVNGLNYDNKSK